MMTEDDEFKRTIGICDGAVSQIKRHHIPAYPRNYDFWYTYAAGINNALNRAVNDILRERGTITATEIDDIYSAHLSQARMTEQMETVGDDMSFQIEHIVSMVDKTIGISSDYRHSLEDASDVLSASSDKAKISQIISELIAATRLSERANKALQKELEDSQSKILSLQEKLETIRTDSLTDELTTLANRKHFDNAMQREVEESRNSHRPLTLLLTDIDHFKKFNDTYGHQTGDQVLRLVALAVKQNIKGQDIACRYGGEEFAVILPNTKLKDAVLLAEQIRKAVMSKELVKRSTGENLGRITISIGVAQLQEGDEIGHFIERADACLYLAKREGRNLVRCETDLEQQHTQPAGNVA